VIVIDSSAFMKFLLKEVNWEKIVPYLDPTSEPHAVDMLIVEGANVMWKYAERYRRITREQAFGLYEQMMKLVNGEVITVEPSKKYLKNALTIALEHSISVYDSLFLAQANLLNARLITSDKRQSEIAESVDIDVTYIE